MPEFLYGHWAVIEAMRSGRRQIDALMIHERAEKRGTVGDVMTMAEELKLAHTARAAAHPRRLGQ